ncbi:MAG: metallophosphoesterase [Deltaproteobacteria bacterium]|nr:metallophosphoesterase [Deltaproteobacteria bacterium]
MKIRVLSDLHLEFGSAEPPILPCDVVVVAGDAGSKDHGVRWALSLPRETPVIYVLGNHEYYGSKIPNQLKKLRSAVRGSHVHILENESLSIQGVRFLGTTLWTDFLLAGDRMRSAVIAMEELADFKKIRVAPRYSRLHPNDTMRFHDRAITWLSHELESDEPTVVVSHHSPTPLSLKPADRETHLSSAFASDLGSLIQEHEPALWVHGHTHRSVDYFIGRTRIISNAAGYPNEIGTGYDPEKIVDIHV